MLFVYKILILICLHKAKAFETYFNSTVVGIAKPYYNLSEAAELFNEFIINFEKNYQDEKEYEFRFNVFKKTLEDINMRNKMADEGEQYGITVLADVTLDEFVHTHTGLVGSLLPNMTTDEKKQGLALKHVVVPESWDWREKRVVTPAMNQLSCQSCWDFSAVGCVESQYAIKHGVLLSLSKQQLLDCYKKTCREGDWPHLGMIAAAKMGGLMLEKDYPYTEKIEKCSFQKSKVHVKLRTGQQDFVKDEETLKKIVYTYGPVSIGIQAWYHGWAKYTHGIAREKSLGCVPGGPITHAVLLVGYGIENNIPYWILKNSSGRKWGENGFMRLIRGRNACSILSYVASAHIQ